MEEKLKDMTEEQIQRVPITNINIFVGAYLRILNVRHRDGAVVLEDGFAEIPERPVESSTDEFKRRKTHLVPEEFLQIKMLSNRT